MANEVWYINGVYSAYSAKPERDEAAKALADRFSGALRWRDGKKFCLGLRRLPDGSHTGAPVLVGPVYEFVWHEDRRVEFVRELVPDHA
jgi:hypothetical protein